MPTLRKVTLLCLALVLGLLGLPLAQAADNRIEIYKDHTDGFYVVTTSGTPVVKVANGIHNTLYDPNDVIFVIDSSTYGKDYAFQGLDRSSTASKKSASNSPKQQARRPSPSLATTPSMKRTKTPPPPSSKTAATMLRQEPPCPSWATPTPTGTLSRRAPTP